MFRRIASSILALVVLANVCAAQGNSQQQQTPALDLPFVAGKRWAIIVGANGYENYEKLKCATNDAKSLAKTLIERYRFSVDTVKILTDDGAPTATPTAGHIIGEVEQILVDKRLDKGDLFVFFFSGHGQGTAKGDFLLPTDARKETVERIGLPVSELIDRFSKAGLKNVLIAVDACRTGTENHFGQELADLGRQTKIAVMLGCEPGGNSYENLTRRHGYFTDSLLTALDDQKLREPTSGALWASAIAESVREKTVQVTSRDFGNYPQRPSTWTNKMQDVLLGAFPPEKGAALTSFLSKAGSLDKDAYVSALVSYADSLGAGADWDAAAEVLRTAQSLGQLGEYASVLAGIAFMNVDRMREADAVLTKLKESNSNSYWQQLGLIYWADLHNDTDLANTTADRLWSKYRDKRSGAVCFYQFVYHAPRTRTLALLQQMVRLPDLADRERFGIEGGIGYFGMDYKTAADSLTKALDCEGTLPSDDDLITLLTGSLTAERNPDKAFAALTMLDKMISQSRAFGTCHLWKGGILQYMQNTGGAKKEYAAALKNIKYPGRDFFKILPYPNSFYPLMADEIMEAASKYELSSSAQLAAFFAHLAKGEKLSQNLPLLAKAQLLAGDEIGFWEDVYGLAENIFDTYSQWTGLAKLCGTRILRKVSATQLDRKVWPILLEAFRFDTPRLDFLLKKSPPSFAGFATDRQYVAELLWDFLIDYGDDASMAEWQDKFKSLELFSEEMVRLRALHLAAVKRDFTASAELRTHIRRKDDYHDPILDALLACGPRDKRKAEGAIAKLDDKIASHRFTKLLCNIMLNKEGADQAIRQLVAESDSWYRYFVNVAVYSEAHKSLHRKFDEKLWSQLYEFASSYPTANTKEWYFGNEANIGNFTGTAKLHITPFNDDDTIGKGGVLTLNCLPGGDINGTYEEETGAVAVISGKYDRFGNLTATLRMAGHESQIIGKLLPNQLPEGSKERPAQRFIVLDQTSMSHWYGRPTGERK